MRRKREEGRRDDVEVELKDGAEKEGGKRRRRRVRRIEKIRGDKAWI